MSRHPELIRARALAFASGLVREVGVVRGRSRGTGDVTRLRQLADDNARLLELLAQPTPAELPSKAPSRALDRFFEHTL